MSANLIQGPDIALGLETYILPPLPLVKIAGIKVLMAGGDVFDEAYTKALTDAIFHSLKRNYPDIKMETVENGVDLSNFQDTVEKFLIANKLDKQEGNAEDPKPEAASQ